MSASQYIKSQGLPSVLYVAGMSGINRQLLHNWYHSKNELFRVVVHGVKMREYDGDDAYYIDEKERE